MDTQSCTFVTFSEVTAGCALGGEAWAEACTDVSYGDANRTLIDKTKFLSICTQAREGADAATLKEIGIIENRVLNCCVGHVDYVDLEN